MNGSYPQQPGYPQQQPGYPPPPRREGMSCLAKGCLVVAIVVMAIGIGIGALGYLSYRSVTAFLSTSPVAIRTFPATDAQYEEVSNRGTAFVQSLQSGKAATLSLSADDLNILIARAPAFSKLRGKAFVSLVDNQLVAECDFPIENKGSPRGASYYASGRVYLLASFASGEFTIVPRRIESMNGQSAPTFINFLLKNPDFARGFNESFNESFNDELRKNPDAGRLVARLHTVVIQDNRIVVTAQDGTPVELPTATPVANPSPEE